MSEDDRRRWEERYRTGDYRPRELPSPFLVHALEVVPPGPALVLACGTGRNALYLAESGFEVEAVDISEVAIARARAEAEVRDVAVDFRVTDLDEMQIPTGAYQLVTMIRYVNRDLWPQTAAALRPDGWLLCELHLRTHLEVRGPGDEFRVEPGELLDTFGGLRVIEYAEVLEPADREGELPAALARLLACNGEPGI